MRSYRDLDSGKKPVRGSFPREANVRIDSGELRRASMLTLCPSVFDEDPFEQFKAPPEAQARPLSVAGAMYDPGGRLDGATEVDETIARARSNDYPGRVLSVVVSGPGPGGEAYGSKPIRVVVPGYRAGAQAYYLGSQK
jgi:hypothetical protein